MPTLRYALLENRGLLAVEGADAKAFLQGLISNDVDKLSPERALYGAFLTPQGKFLFDFFLFEKDGVLFLDCEAERAADFRRRLTLYRLRSKVEITDRSQDFAIAALFGDGVAEALGLPGEEGAAAPFAGGIVFVDPRLGNSGARAVVPAADVLEILAGRGFERSPFAAYDSHRAALGLPDGSRDMIVEKTTLLEAGFEELHGIDFDKGCYLGQELTARTKYRGLVKRRLIPVRIDGPAPATGTPILMDGKEVGEVRSTVDGVGMALMRLEHLGRDGYTAGEAKVVPVKPAWVNF